MKKSMLKVLVIGLVAFGGFDCRAEVTAEMIKACSNDVQAILALLPQATGQTQINAIHSVAVARGNRSNAVEFAESLGASALVVSYAKVVQASALKDPKAVTMAAKSHFESYGGSSWKLVRAKYLTKDEAVEFYELVLKNVALTEETKDRLGEIKGELLKLKDL
jgi:hypothetical protein